MTLKTNEKANILLEGPIGTGKTSSLKTILNETDKELFVLATEPGIHTILGELAETDKTGRVHWHYVSPAKVEWDTLLSNASQINKLPMEALQKTNMSKSEYKQFIEVLSALADFTCQRPDCPCGNKSFGPVDSWGPERVLAIDGLTGLSKMAMDLVTGAKPIKTLPEWGVAQDNLRRLLDKLTTDTACSFVLIAHMDKKQNQITGGTYLTVSTLGQALAPDIPKFFDEVIYAYRQGDGFFWSTVEANTDLKSRILPLEEEITPTFAHFFGKTN